MCHLYMHDALPTLHGAFHVVWTLIFIHADSLISLLLYTCKETHSKSTIAGTLRWIDNCFNTHYMLESDPPRSFEPSYSCRTSVRSHCFCRCTVVVAAARAAPRGTCRRRRDCCRSASAPAPDILDAKDHCTMDLPNDNIFETMRYRRSVRETPWAAEGSFP